MSVKTVKKVREGRPFRPADLIVYGALAVIIVALFTAFVFTRTASPLTELYVDVEGERALVWTAGDQTLTVTATWRERVDTAKDGDTTKVTIWTDDDKTRYNVIEFSAAGAKITDANCSAHKDCVHTAAITDTAGVIVCVPHKLKIYSSGERNPSLG